MNEKTNKRCLFMVMLLGLVSSWDPDAGYIPSWTKMPGVTASASSNSNYSNNVLDNNDNTHWTSEACLPAGYVQRADENILLGQCTKGTCVDSTGTQGDSALMTDGSFYTVAHFTTHTNVHGNTQAMVTMRLDSPVDLQLMSIWGVYNEDTHLSVKYQHGITEEVRVLQSSDNYKQITITKALNNVVEINIKSNKSFQMKEISSLGTDGCKERITVDLGVPRNIGVVRTRHWAGSNSATDLNMKFSLDKTSWISVASLVPNALHAVMTSVSPSQSMRYIQLEYKLVPKNYNKVYCWEIDAWDQYQRWGRPVVANAQTNKMRDILGVNGIWGWQHSKYSSSLKIGEGPFLYNAVATHARNYHNMDWDVTAPNKDPQYERMANNQGTQAKSWLNWDTEYRAWRNASLLIDVSFQFTNKSFPENTWLNPEQEAYYLGRHFANHFGTEHGNGLVDAVEVGNEPWHYRASFYNTVLKGMTAGLRSADSKIKILPGAFQADDKFDEGNYIGTRVTQDVSVNISIVNFHTYSFKTTQNGVRVATYPEDPHSTFNSIRNIVRWRDQNMPTKPIWVTEWGWDADGQGESCSFSECVSEEAQALYGIRGLLILTRSNVQKVTWFFYANSQTCNTLFCRSGLTSSILHNFAKKNVFHAFEELHRRIGNRYFLGVFKEDVDGYAYLFSSSPYTTRTNNQQLLQHASHVVAWKPVDVSDTTVSNIQMQLPNNVHRVLMTKFTGNTPATEDVTPNIIGTTLNLQLSKNPIVVELNPSGIDSGHVVG